MVSENQVRPFAVRAGAMAILPAGPAPRENVEPGVAVLAELGLAVVLPDSLFEPPDDSRPWLAGSDGTRIRRIEAAIAGGAETLWLVRGGFGSARLLPDGVARWQRAEEARAGTTPPTLVAFSDGTALLSAWHKAGWPAWSGPPLTQLPRLDDLSIARLRALLHASHVAPFADLEALSPGEAVGPTFVANLCVLTSLCGTPFAPDLRGHVVVLEDTGEPPYKLDRMLTQLVQAGVLEGVAGVAFADFTADRKVPAQTLIDLESVFRHFVREFAAARNIPVCMNVPIGHGSANALVPVGRASGFVARLDVNDAQATLGWSQAKA